MNSQQFGYRLAGWERGLALPFWRLDQHRDIGRDRAKIDGKIERGDRTLVSRHGRGQAAMVRRWFPALAIFALTGPVPLLAWAASHAIVQKNRAFDAADVAIAAGDSLLFTNEDPFLHQIYVKSATTNFESSEQPPGQTVEVRFPTAGAFTVRCHIHPTMSLAVIVK
jgi:plastocyanin